MSCVLQHNGGIHAGKESSSIHLTKLPNIYLQNDHEKDYGDLKNIVSRIEARVRTEQKRSSKVSRESKRQIAAALSREAEKQFHKGNYEAALLVYHRAVQLYPRDNNYKVALARTEIAISSAANPSPALRKLLPEVRNSAQLSAILCPESATLTAKNILKKSLNPSSHIPHILSCIDCHKDFWRQPSAQSISRKLSRLKIVSQQYRSMTKKLLKELEAAFEAKNIQATFSTAEKLLITASNSRDSYYYQILAYQYMALTEVLLNRHDRAVNHVSKMIKIAKASNNDILKSQAMITLGKVHLSFGHLESLVRVWERLSNDLKESVPRAWLFHEIGRCYFELERFEKTLEAVADCLKAAKEAGSKKWILYGYLLWGQTLIRLDRFREAFKMLKVSDNIIKEEGDTHNLSYIRNLLRKVKDVLRNEMQNFYVEGNCRSKIFEADIVQETNLSSQKSIDNEMERCLIVSLTNSESGKSISENDEEEIGEEHVSEKMVSEYVVTSSDYSCSEALKDYSRSNELQEHLNTWEPQSFTREVISPDHCNEVSTEVYNFQDISNIMRILDDENPLSLRSRATDATYVIHNEDEHYDAIEKINDQMNIIQSGNSTEKIPSLKKSPTIVDDIYANEEIIKEDRCYSPVSCESEDTEKTFTINRFEKSLSDAVDDEDLQRTRRALHEYKENTVKREKNLYKMTKLPSSNKFSWMSMFSNFRKNVSCDSSDETDD